MKRFNESFNDSLHTSYHADKVELVCKRRELTERHRRAGRRALLALVFGLMLLCDLCGQMKVGWSFTDLSFVWWSELLLLVVCMVYSFVEGMAFLSYLLIPNYVEVDENEKTLFGIKDGEPGFCISPLKPVAESPTHKISFTSHASPYSYQKTPNCSFSPGAPKSLGTPLNLDETIRSTSAHSGHTNGSFHKNAQSSFSERLGLSFDDGSNIRCRVSPMKNPMHREEDYLMSERSLDTFIINEAAKDRTEQVIQEDMNASLTSSFWNVNRTVLDYVPLLRKFQYQMAPRHSSSTTNSSQDDDPDHPAKYSADELWTKMGIQQYTVDLWIENLRYWLGQTIVQRLAEEIKKVNAELRKIGSEDAQIGEVSVSALKNLAFSKAAHVPSLNHIIPYLEVSTKQDYLVYRIKELGKDGCIADFNWDGGCTYNGKPWSEDLPSDAKIIMHIFCTYMDSRLPGNPKYADGKVFTTQHFMRTPDKPDLKQKNDYLVMYQTKIKPPHFKVIVGSDIYDFIKGRNNMFQCILFFIHRLQQHERGMLGHVNLGKSGINILWVLTQKYR